MANISVYHDNVLSGGSTVTATGILANSSATYAGDDRLSFKMTTSGVGTTIEIDQPATNNRSFTDLALIDHDIDGGTVTVTSYPTSARSTPTTELAEQLIPNEDPFIISVGALTNTQFLDVVLVASGSNTVSIGEVMLATKFDSPVRPAIGIRTEHIPRQTFITMPNGERQAIKHAQVIRRKGYRVGGLSISQAQEWVDLFDTNEATGLVILDDDRGDTYPALMATELIVNDETKVLTIDLTFEEIKL